MIPWVKLRSFNLSFLKLKQLFIDGGTESNPEPTQNDCKYPGNRPKQIKVFKGTQKNVILVKTVMFVFLVTQGYKHFFQCNLTSHLIEPWSVTCRSNFKKWNLRWVMNNNNNNNSVNKTLVGERVTDRAIEEV